jgi:hypothetical protein
MRRDLHAVGMLTARIVDMVFRKSLAVYEVPLIWCDVSARSSVGSAPVEETMRVIVTYGLRRTRTPDLNSYVCCLWGTLKGECSMNNPLLLEGGREKAGNFYSKKSC